jgi:hypothetical protein
VNALPEPLGMQPLGREAATVALYAWDLCDPEDQAEFGRDDEFVRELALEAAPFLGQLQLEQACAELADRAVPGDPRQGWRSLCEARARELFPEADAAVTEVAPLDDGWLPAARVDDDADVWC